MNQEFYRRLFDNANVSSCDILQYPLLEVSVLWQSPPSNIALPIGEAHLWRATLNCTDAQLNMFLQSISPLELAQSQKFIRKNDQRQCVMSCALTRKILAQYLKKNVLEIEFQYGPHGKPFIKNQALQFNISHSGDYFLLGVSHQTIGVDVEHKRDRCDYNALAQRFFTESEYRAIQNKCDFYRCWTRKEAFIKATGLGLSFGLSNFEVIAKPCECEQSALISVHHDVGLAKPWFLQSIVFDESSPVFAAYCVENSGQKIIFKSFVLNCPFP